MNGKLQAATVHFVVEFPGRRLRLAINSMTTSIIGTWLKSPSQIRSGRGWCHRRIYVMPHVHTFFR